MAPAEGWAWKPGKGWISGPGAFAGGVLHIARFFGGFDKVFKYQPNVIMAPNK